jgi:hypothetical protein
MSTYTNSITNIVNSGYTNNYTSKQASQLNEIIKSSTLDSVYFSNESKNLFQISQIDTILDSIFGIPKNLTTDQQIQLDELRKGLDGIYSNNSSQLEIIDFDKIFKNLDINDENTQQIKELTNELNKYLVENSISQLFGNSSSNTLSFLSNGYNTILGEKLTTEESQKLGTLSLQLNRLFFSDDNNQLSSYLNLFNNVYGLNTPNEQELFDAKTLITQRNSLLSSVLLNRSYQSTYTN